MVPSQTPLLSIGQGDYRRDYPAQSADGGVVELRFLTREPADVYHGKTGDFLTSHTLKIWFDVPDRAAVYCCPLA